MAIKLGKDGSQPAVGSADNDIISATYTEECEVIDVTNRTNKGGTENNPGYRAYKAGLVSKLWEFECHDATGLVAKLESNALTNNFIVMGVSENVSIDGAVTFTVTAREGAVIGGS